VVEVVDVVDVVVVDAVVVVGASVVVVVEAVVGRASVVFSGEAQDGPEQPATARASESTAKIASPILSFMDIAPLKPGFRPLLTDGRAQDSSSFGSQTGV
jgi:hypothetical protein